MLVVAMPISPVGQIDEQHPAQPVECCGGEALVLRALSRELLQLLLEQLLAGADMARPRLMPPPTRLHRRRHKD